jgi:hypothetical protein
LGLGNYYTDEFGCVNDSYGVLSNMISNRFMVDNKDTRVRLMSEFNLLKPISKTNERPIMFSTLEPASICLQADVRHYQEHHQITSDKDASSGQVNLSDNSSGTARSVSPQDSASAGNPYGIRADASEALDSLNGSDGLNDLNRLLTDVLAEASPPIFSADFPLQEHKQRVQLAKLVIAKNLGKEKTIFLLWGVTSGGRNHQRYADARDMLERLIKGEDAS